MDLFRTFEFKTLCSNPQTCQEKQKLDSKLIKLKERIAYLESITPDAVKHQYISGIRQQAGSKSVYAFVLTLVIVSIFAFFIFSEFAFAKEIPERCIFVGLDVTSSNQSEREANEAAVLALIDKLKPKDHLIAGLITQSSFEKPELVLDHHLPARPGAFNRKLIAYKRLVIREFKSKMKELNRERKSSSVFMGIYLFAQLLSEQPAKSKYLVIFSDMRECYNGVNIDTIANKGDKVLSMLKGEELIAELNNVKIYVMGVTPNDANPVAWRKLKKFWKAYFKESGAELMRYSISRQSID